jgi:hypothetical protein
MNSVQTVARGRVATSSPASHSKREQSQGKQHGKRAMKALMITVALLAPPGLHAQDAETVLGFEGNTVSYADVKPDGGLQVKEAWDGYRIVKRVDGNCYRIDHTNLRIEKVGIGQRALFDESVTPISCH